MKKAAAAALLIILAAVCSPCVFAMSGDMSGMYAEQMQASGADELADALPEETAGYLNELGVTVDDTGDMSGVLSVMSEIVSEAGSDIVKSFGCTGGLLMIAAMMNSVTDGARSLTMNRTVSAAINAALCIIIAAPAAEYIADACRAAESCCRFDEALIPVYCAVTAASGGRAQAAGFGAFLLPVLEAAALFLTEITLPALRMILAVSLTSSLSPSLRLGGAVELLEKNLKWLLGFAAAMAVGAAGLSGVSSAAADKLTGRAAKYVVTGAVPVLGTAMGEALSSVTGCIGLLRASVGSFGVIAMAFILIPPLIRGALWRLSLGICSLLAETLGVKYIRTLTDAIGSVISIMTAVLVFTAALTVFTLAAAMGGSA